MACHLDMMCLRPDTLCYGLIHCVYCPILYEITDTLYKAVKDV